MKKLVAFSVLGLFALTLVGCGGGMSTDDFKAVWKTAIDGYAKDVAEKKKDPKGLDVRLDEAAKAKGAKDWADLCTKVATSDPDGYKKVTEEMGKYSTDEITKATKKAAGGGGEEKKEEKKEGK